MADKARLPDGGRGGAVRGVAGVTGSLFEGRMASGVQEGLLPRLMPLVAIEALHLPAVPLKVLLTEVLAPLVVAGQAKLRHGRAQEDRILPAVGLMADQAIVLARGMNRHRPLRLLDLAVTAEAERGRRGHQKGRLLGAVGVMALRA